MRLYLILILSLYLYGCSALPNPITPQASPLQTQAVIFDIDGTLTPTLSAIFGVRKDAARTVKYFADHQYQVIYLSARTPMLQKNIPQWLTSNNFPKGLLYVPQTEQEAKTPTQFKTRILQELKAQGWTLAYAFGDSTTDFEAYAQAGMAQAQVFALQRRAAKTCQPGIWQACLSGWTEFDATLLTHESDL